MAELTLALIVVLAQPLLPSACRFDILEATIIAGPTFSAEPTNNAESCGTSCCDAPHCIAFSFIADNPTSIPGHGCVRGGSCCFLRSAVTPTRWPQNWNPAVRSAYVNKTKVVRVGVVPAVPSFVRGLWPTCSSPGDTHKPGRSLTARTAQTRSRLLPQCVHQQEAPRTKRHTARHRKKQIVPLEPQSPKLVSNGSPLRSLRRVHVNPEPTVEPIAARKRKRWVYLIQGSSVRHYPRLRPGPDRDVVFLIWKKTAVPPIPHPSSPHHATRVLYRPGLTFTQGRNALLQEALAMSKDQPAPG